MAARVVSHKIHSLLEAQIKLFMQTINFSKNISKLLFRVRETWDYEGHRATKVCSANHTAQVRILQEAFAQLPPSTIEWGGSKSY
jgi:hypothetical protein